MFVESLDDDGLGVGAHRKDGQDSFCLSDCGAGGGEVSVLYEAGASACLIAGGKSTSTKYEAGYK